jgi:hypothetical protein
MFQRLREPRRLLALASLLVSVASWSWVSPWLGVGFFALGVATVAIDVHERRQKGADDPAVLSLGPASGPEAR